MATVRNRIFETNFTVFPQDTNYMPPMVFGGKVMSEMDIAAAMAVRRACNDSPTAKHAVTTRVDDIQFHVGAEIGDLVFLRAEVIHTGRTSLRIRVTGERETKDGDREPICEGTFVFVTVRFLDEEERRKLDRRFVPVPHELVLGV